MRSAGVAGVLLVVAALGCTTESGAPGATADPTTTSTPVDPPTSAAPTTAPSTTPPPTTTSTAPPTTTPPSTTPRSATLTFTGDILLHSRLWRAGATAADEGDPDGYDFRAMFAPIEPWIREADWSVCHLEVPLSADDTRLRSYPVFRGPGAIAVDLAEVGFDSCSTASNHSLDGGIDGIAETIGVLEDAGLRFTGTARTERERWDSIWVDVAGFRIAHLAYTYWFNGFRLPDDRPWAANEIELDRILDDARRAKQEGAEVVIVSLHWGEQYRHDPNPLQSDLGPTLSANTDVDLVIGHHAHVVQPIVRPYDDWVVYGVGNLLHNQTQLRRRDELLVEAELRDTDDGIEVSLRVVPLFLDLDEIVIRPTAPGLRPVDLTSSLEAQLDASYERVITVLDVAGRPDELVIAGE